MPKYSRRLDFVFHGLADPTRRAVLIRLSRGPASVSEMARESRMALPSFVQHLSVLERGGLVRSRKSGRVRIYQIAPEPLHAAEQWLEAQRAHWSRRLDQLDDYLLKLKGSKS